MNNEIFDEIMKMIERKEEKKPVLDKDHFINQVKDADETICLLTDKGMFVQGSNLDVLTLFGAFTSSLFERFDKKMILDIVKKSLEETEMN